MRALVVHPGPNFSVADIFTGLAEGLREHGVIVNAYDLSNRLGFYGNAGRMTDEGEFVRFVDDEGAARLAAKGIEAECFRFWPDVVIVISCFYVPPDILAVIRARNIKVVIVHLESPYEDGKQLARAAHADLNTINDPTNLDRFNEIAPTIYMPHAYRPTVHRPGPATPDYVSDFCMVATGFPSRIAFLEAVDWTGIDVALAGNWQALDAESPLRKFVAHDIEECIDNDQAVELYRSTKVSANLYRREAEQPALSTAWAMGPREVELAATGCMFLREHGGEGDAVLPMVPTFDRADPRSFEAKLRFYLAHHDERQAIADAARAAVVGRTFAANAAQLLRHLTG